MKIKHPCTIVSEFMKKNKLTIKDIADRIGVPEKELKNILDNRKMLSEMMIIGFERAFGLSRDSLMARKIRKNKRATELRRKISKQLSLKHTKNVTYEDYLLAENAKLMKQGKISIATAEEDVIRNMRRNKGIDGGGMSHIRSKADTEREFNGKVLSKLQQVK